MGPMHHEETLGQLRALREAVTRVVRDVDAAIAHMEAFQPVAEAFERWQAAARAQWEDLMRAGGPDNLDIEAQTRHATELRSAEVALFNALKDYLGDTRRADGQPPEGQQQEYHPS